MPITQGDFSWHLFIIWSHRFHKHRSIHACFPVCTGVSMSISQMIFALICIPLWIPWESVEQDLLNETKVNMITVNLNQYGCSFSIISDFVFIEWQVTWDMPCTMFQMFPERFCIIHWWFFLKYVSVTFTQGHDHSHLPIYTSKGQYRKMIKWRP